MIHIVMTLVYLCGIFGFVGFILFKLGVRFPLSSCNQDCNQGRKCNCQRFREENLGD